MPATTESSEVVNQSQEEDDEDMNSCETLCTTTWGLCDTVIGVLGGGQLGRMLCQAASPMGIRVSVLDPLPDCPAGKIAFHHQVGSFKDMQAVREFAKGCGALTVEIEHVDVETLETLARENGHSAQAFHHPHHSGPAVNPKTRATALKNGKWNVNSFVVECRISTFRRCTLSNMESPCRSS